MRFEVLMVMTMRNTVFWKVMTSNLVEVYCFVLYHVDPLLSNDSVNNGHNEFLTCPNGLTGKQCSVHGPCDSYMMRQ
jgi:hypothetical protein